MAKVEITSTPPGQAPEWVRNAWIGLMLPVDENPNGILQIGVHGGRAQNKGGYSVPTEEALKILGQANDDAAQWWYDNLPVMPSWLVFHRDVCRFVEE
jgi:hypothetical protein